MSVEIESVEVIFKFKVSDCSERWGNQVLMINDMLENMHAASPGTHLDAGDKDVFLHGEEIQLRRWRDKSKSFIWVAVVI